MMNNPRMKKQQLDALWRHVHWLDMLAETGSYTATAARLGVSKAAVSQRIRELEAAAGVPLVRRTTRSLRLTEAGEGLVEATRGAFAQIERSFAGVRELADTPRGVLRVTAPVALGRQHIVPLVPAFLRAYPELSLELDLSAQISSLARDGFDVAIRHVSVVPETHVAWTLCETRSVLVASPDYLRRRGVPADPRALAGHDCLGYRRGGGSLAWRFEPLAGGAPLAVLSDFTARQALLDGLLVPVLPDWRPVGLFGDRLCAIRPYSPTVPKAVQVFVAWLRDALKDGFGLAP